MKFGNVIKKMRLYDGMVLLVKADSEIGKHAEEIAGAIDGGGYSNILVVVADELDDVRALPDREMKKIGWVRFPVRNPTHTTLVTMKEIEDPRTNGRSEGDEFESPDDTPSEHEQQG